METFLTGFVWGLIAAFVIYQMVKKVEYPHKWACPREDCNFVIRANEKSALRIAQQVHNHISS